MTPCGFAVFNLRKQAVGVTPTVFGIVGAAVLPVCPRYTKCISGVMYVLTDKESRQ